MKKTIILSTLAIFTFSNVSLASSATGALISKEISVENNDPFCRAISKGDITTVKKFIEYGVDVNETSNGMTPLMLAARYNNVAMLKLLINKGANPDYKDERGNTALQIAKLSNAQEAIDYLSKV